MSSEVSRNELVSKLKGILSANKGNAFSTA